MNGFNKGILFITLYLVSCTRIVDRKSNEVLFIIYKNTTQSQRTTLNMWNSPQLFIHEEQKNLSLSTVNILSIMDSNLFVVRVGQIKNGKQYFIKKIEYKDKDVYLDVFLEENTSQNQLSDLGYPIFLRNTPTKAIRVLTNNALFFITNK